MPEAMPRAIWATSRECVSRVLGVSPSRGPTTWVLSASRRSAAEWRTRARSREKALRLSTDVAAIRLPFGVSSQKRALSSAV